MARVTLLSDFGTRDGYVAAMAGVVAAAAPHAILDHATHDVAPGDVFGAALALSRYADRYPPGTVHLAVVDPGVGTARRPLAATVDGRHYVAPDNGLLTLVLQRASSVRLVEISPPPGAAVSATFHGRDVFAPAAGRLARGDDLADLGPAVVDPRLLPIPEPERDEARVRGVVLEVDRFGNLITNIPGPWLATGDRVEVAGQTVGWSGGSYGDVEPGELVALTGSLGLLEVSVRDDSAADRLGVGRGSPVTCVRGQPGGG